MIFHYKKIVKKSQKKYPIRNGKKLFCLAVLFENLRRGDWYKFDRNGKTALQNIYNV